MRLVFGLCSHEHVCKAAKQKNMLICTFFFFWSSLLQTANSRPKIQISNSFFSFSDRLDQKKMFTKTYRNMSDVHGHKMPCVIESVMPIINRNQSSRVA